MNFRPTKTEEVDVNLTPLIDVVFLLLIFFMVSTTFVKDESEIAINLPKASEEPKQVVSDKIEITIDAEGQYFINNNRLINTKLDTIKRALKKVAGDQKNPVIVIKADANTPHQAVISAMDASRQLGFSRLGFATIQQAQ